MSKCAVTVVVVLTMKLKLMVLSNLLINVISHGLLCMVKTYIPDTPQSIDQVLVFVTPIKTQMITMNKSSTLLTLILTHPVLD